MTDFSALFQRLHNGTLSGVFQLSHSAGKQFYEHAHAAGLHPCRINLAKVTSTRALHLTLARALHFPDYYGANWDALADCLSDLSWMNTPAYILILDSGHTLQNADPEGFEQFIAVLHDSAQFWQSQQKSFFCTLTGTQAGLPEAGEIQ